jgi:hypothetical protein
MLDQAVRRMLRTANPAEYDARQARVDRGYDGRVIRDLCGAATAGSLATGRGWRESEGISNLGRVVEWFKAAVLKTVVALRVTVGSNPTPSVLASRLS